MSIPMITQQDILNEMDKNIWYSRKELLYRVFGTGCEPIELADSSITSKLVRMRRNKSIERKSFEKGGVRYRKL